MNERTWVFPAGAFISIVQTFIVIGLFEHRLYLWHNSFYFLVLNLLTAWFYTQSSWRWLVGMMTAGSLVGYIGYLYALFEARGSLFNTINALLNYSFVFLCFTLIGVLLERYIVPKKGE